MKKLIYVLLFFLSAQLSFNNIYAQYNTLKIPDTLPGTNFNLVIKDTFAQYKTGNQTITSAVNNNNFWGPTLIMNNGLAMQIRYKINQPQ